MKQGLVEKREHARVQVALKASYDLLSDEKAKEYVGHPGYVRQNLPADDGGAFRFFFKGETNDISEGGMALVGTEAFQKGQKILIKFELPSVQTELTYVAEVRWVQQFEEIKRPMYRAGLRFLFLKMGDAKMMHKYIMGRLAKKQNT